MCEEIGNKFQSIMKEIKSSKSVSTVTNPSSTYNDNQNDQLSESKCNKCIGVHASNNKNLDPEDDHPLRASDMKELRNTAKTFFQNGLNQDETIVSNEDAEEADY